MYIDTEAIRRAAGQMSVAADDANRAANRLDEATSRAQAKPFKSGALTVKSMPSRAEIIDLVSSHFGLTNAEAIILLMGEFSVQGEAA